MDLRLLALGVNVVLASVLLTIYGLLNDNVGLVGLATSAGIIGGVLIVYSIVPTEPSIKAILSYTSMLANTVTSVLEDMDLLSSRICALSTGDSVLITYSKVACPDNVNPGIGFIVNSPYLSIPANVFKDVTELEELSVKALEEALTSVLVDDLSLCRVIRVEQRGDLIVIHITGMAKYLIDYNKHPLNPIVLLVLAMIARLVGTGKVYLIEKSDIPGLTRLVVRVEKSA